jgi:putative transposase
MFAIILSLVSSVRQGFRTRVALQAEILALRHQLLVLQRSTRSHKVRLSAADRLLWVWLARLWSEWRSALVIVEAETVIACHRRGFRLYWSWKNRHRPGRPRVVLGIYSHVIGDSQRKAVEESAQLLRPN